MIRPARRMVLGAAAVAAPLCALAGFYPPAAWVCYAGLAVCAALAAADAVRVVRRIGKWNASAPAALQWFRGREEEFAVTLSGQTGEVRVSVEFPPAIETREETMLVRVEEAGTVEIHCIPRKRGDFKVSACNVELPSPFGLWFAARTLPLSARIRVFPDLRRERAADLIRARDMQGVHRRRQLGKGREFEKLREYAAGDSFEDIDWKATARRRHPIVKVFQIEKTQEIYVAIDSSRLSARANALDSYVSAALTLGVVAEAQHDRFGLVTFSAGVDTFVPAATGKRHFATCRDAIYGLQPRPVTPDLEEVFSFLHARLRKRCLLIFLTALDDPILAESFLRDVGVLSRRHMVLLNVPRQHDVQPLFSGTPPATPDEIYGRLAGHMQWTGVRELQSNLHRRGVRMAVVDPPELPRQIARQYLDVKQGQLL